MAALSKCRRRVTLKTYVNFKKLPTSFTGLPVVSTVIKCECFYVVVALTSYLSHHSLRRKLMFIQIKMFDESMFRNEWQLTGMHKLETIKELTSVKIPDGLTMYQSANTRWTYHVPVCNQFRGNNKNCAILDLKTNIFQRAKVCLSCMFTWLFLKKLLLPCDCR